MRSAPSKHAGPPRRGDEELTGFAKGIIGIGALLIAVCGSMFLLDALSEPREVPHEEEDRLGLVTGGDLEPYFRGLVVDAEEEKIVRKEGLLGVWELKYEFSVVSTGGGSRSSSRPSTSSVVSFAPYNSLRRWKSASACPFASESVPTCTRSSATTS
jgi:hypothetical protein